MPIDPRLVQWESDAAPSGIDPSKVKWDDAPVSPGIRGDGYERIMSYNPRDALGGTLRGSGSIGATIIRPFESAQENAQRRDKIDQGLTTLIGSDPSSMAYRSNKLLTEIAGTSGIGGAIANGLRMIPGVARALPTLLPAIESGGMYANGATGAYGMANRIAGGAVNAGATAGLIDPKDASTGMLIGGATPPLVQAAGKVGQSVMSSMAGKPINPQLQQTARESVDAGYVIPPNMVSPSWKSRVLESFSGKQATQQIASIKNTKTTDRLVREALGIPADVPLSKGTLENLRKTAGQAYGEVSALSPQAAADLEALKQARNDAQQWFKAFNRSASPADLAKAKQYRDAATQLETALEQHAAAANRPELIPALRNARKEIAKTYTVERALNDAAGTVDARVLGRMSEKGVPLSDGLDTVGRFASAFPKVAISPQQIGSPAAHNLNALFSLGLGSIGAGGGAAAGMGAVGTGGLGLLGAAAPFVVPPVARSIMFSGPVQRAVTAPARQGTGLLGQTVDEMLPLMYRTNGLLATYGQ